MAQRRDFSVWRRLRYGAPLVVVSGLPRSGTSMAMKMLEAGGLPLVTDGERVADEDNPKGYYEDERVKALGAMEDKSWLRNARGQGIKIISFLLRDLPADNNYRVLFLRRKPDEVLASQAKMLERRGEQNPSDDEKMKELWSDHLLRVGYLLRTAPHIRALDLHYSDVLSDPQAHAEKIAEFCGDGLNVAAMAGVVDPSLYRNRG